MSNKINKMTKADEKFVELLKEVKKGFHRRVGKDLCKELHADCFDCRTRILIGELNHWIDLIEN